MYALKVFSFKGELLYETNFDFDLEISSAPPKEWFDKEGNQIIFGDELSEDDLTIKKGEQVLFIPYFSNIKNAKIFKNKELMLEIDLSRFSLCNENNICDNKETYELCPEECKCGDGICSDEEDYSICSEDCPYEPQLREGASFWRRILEFIKSVF